MKTEAKDLKMELRGDTEVVLTRYFAAPRELVFDCHTKPELMRRWLSGPEGYTMESCEVDLKVGGRYLYVFGNTAGHRGGVYGSFREVSVPEKVSNTENYAMDMSAFKPDTPEDPNAMVESRTFTTEGKGTLLTHVCRYSSAAVRKEMIESGAGPDGLSPNYLVLDKLLQEIA